MTEKGYYIGDALMAKSEGNVYFLCSKIDLKLFNISSDLLNIKEDWKVPFNSFKFDLRDSRLMRAFDHLVLTKKMMVLWTV